MAKQFNFQAAEKAGYSPDEIIQFLSEKNPDFNVQGALESGYSPNEVAEFLSQPKEKSFGEKALRAGVQYATGLAESAALPYDLAVSGYKSEPFLMEQARQNVMDDIEYLAEKKMFGTATPEDEQRYQELLEFVQNPEKLKETITPIDVTVQGLAEKATGMDLEPEGFGENVARIAGFVKDPRKISSLKGFFKNPSKALRSAFPNVGELTRAGGIATGLEIAKDGDYGPIGTMAFMVLGDLAGSGIAGGLKTAKEAVKDPKKFFAKKAVKLANSEKKELQQNLIKSFREQGIQADLGTLTDSNLVRWAQARLSQSGLTGKALDNFKQDLFGQIKDEYKQIANSLGGLRYGSEFEAGRILQDSVKSIREKDLNIARDMYRAAQNSLKEEANVGANKLSAGVQSLLNKLEPGKIKSTQQRQVIDILKDLQQDIRETNLGKRANIQDLINNKIALNDIIDYEVQGGTKQLLKDVVKDLDRAIISYGKENPKFARNYVAANRKFSQHAKKFRNKELTRLLNADDPTKILKKMDSVAGIKNLEKIIAKGPEGKKLFDEIKRFKLEEIFTKTFVNSTEKQLQAGTFANLLDKGKNRALVKELLGTRNFYKLGKLQKNTGILNRSAQKFINQSQSGVVATDAAIVGKGISDAFQLLSGNPWPLLKSGSVFTIAKNLSNMITDPEFLKIVEDIILQSKKENTKSLFDSMYKLKPYVMPFIQDQISSDREVGQL